MLRALEHELEKIRAIDDQGTRDTWCSGLIGIFLKLNFHNFMVKFLE